MMEHFGRWPDLFDPCLVHHHHSVRHLERFFLVVRHQNRGDMDLFVQPPQPIAQPLPHLGIERAERFIEQQHPRFDGERPRQRYALPLPARKLRRIPVAKVFKLNQLQQFINLRRNLLTTRSFRTGPHPQSKRDVFKHRHVLEQRVVLKHKPDLPAADALLRDILTMEQHF